SMSKALLLVLALTMVLAACSSKNNGGNGTSSPSPTSSPEGTQAPAETQAPLQGEDGLFNIANFSNVKSSSGEPIEGGTLTYGLISDTPFEGTLNYNFYDGNPDAEVLGWFDEGLLTWDSSYVYTNDGAATYEVSEDGHTFTFTIRDNVNWQDGTPVTA